MGRRSLTVTMAAIMALWSLVAVPEAVAQATGAITSAPPPEGVVGATYVHQFTSSGLSPAPTYSVTGPVPPGVLIDAQGNMFGVPNAAGTFGPTTVCANNGVQPPACQTFTVVIRKLTPILFSDPSAGGPLGTAVRNTTSVGSQQQPTGTVTFRLYSDAACTNEVFSSINVVDAQGRAVSNDFVPTAPGTYRWSVFYSGDANHEASSFVCSPVNTVTITGTTTVPPTTTSTTPTTSTTSTVPPTSTSTTVAPTSTSTSAPTTSSTTSTSTTSTTVPTGTTTSSSTSTSTSTSTTSTTVVPTSTSSSTSTSSTVIPPSTTSSTAPATTTTVVTATSSTTTPSSSTSSTSSTSTSTPTTTSPSTTLAPTTTVAATSSTTSTALGATTTTVPGPSISVDPAQVAPGQSLTVTGSGFPPGAPLAAELFSDPVQLGTATADASGRFRMVVTVPLDTAPGVHTLRVSVVGGTQSASASLLVTTPAPPQRATGIFQTLSRTGGDFMRRVGTALGLMLTGFVLVGLAWNDRRPLGLAGRRSGWPDRRRWT